MIKDKEAAIKIIKALIDKKEENFIQYVFSSIPQKWKKKIIKGLEEIKEKEILAILIK